MSKVLSSSVVERDNDVASLLFTHSFLVEQIFNDKSSAVYLLLYIMSTETEHQDHTPTLRQQNP